MSEAKAPVGQIRTEVRGHVLKIIIDNPAKKNSFSPQMMFRCRTPSLFWIIPMNIGLVSFARKVATSRQAWICRSFSVQKPRTGT